MSKEIMNGYTGIKFEAICVDIQLPDDCQKLIENFKKNGLRLLEYNMAPANGGNISAKYQNGFFITSSGCNLGCVEDNEVILVEEFSLEDKLVKYRGCCPPSSETFLHGLLYENKPDILAVVHAHDEIATSMDLSGILDETDREEPYGTIELAKICLETFQKDKEIIILKNHGYVAIASTLTQATDTVINMHNNLIQQRRK